MSLLRRLEKLERESQTKRDGSCLACALTRLGGGEVSCSGQSCGMGLAAILTSMGAEDARATEAA